MIVALLALKGRPRQPLLSIAHGLAGAAGLVLLLLASRGPRQGDAMGVGSFGIIAAALFLSALVLGPCVPMLRQRAPSAAGMARVIHACLAITAFVLFLAWASVS